MLAAGRLVVIPTETVYGLGASAINRDAVRAVFDAKDRPQDNPLIVHLGEMDSTLEIVPAELGLTRAILAEFAPGPITVILPAPRWAIPEVRAGLPTIALRIPSLELSRRVITAAGIPIAAPSANRSGRPSPTTAAMAYEEMAGRVAAVLDGGDCDVGIESTIVDATNDREAIILRPGRISASEITHRLGCPARGREPGDSHAPGTRFRHYTPNVPVVLVEPQDLIEAEREAKHAMMKINSAAEPMVLSRERYGSIAAYEENLYRAFWNAEREGCPLILAERPSSAEAEGLADRLRHAAGAIYDKGVAARMLVGI